MSIVLAVSGVAFGAFCIWFVVQTVNGAQKASGYGMNWPVVTRYVIYAAIVGMILALASMLFPQVQS